MRLSVEVYKELLSHAWAIPLHHKKDAAYLEKVPKRAVKLDKGLTHLSYEELCLGWKNVNTRHFHPTIILLVFEGPQ